MSQLTEQERKELIRLLQAGERIPMQWRAKLFPGGTQSVEIGKEYRLEYAGKMKREQVLAETPAAPWQLVRRFAEERPHGDGWRICWFGATTSWQCANSSLTSRGRTA